MNLTKLNRGVSSCGGDDMLQVTIQTDNAAFDDDAVPELERILDSLKLKLRGGETSGKLFDLYGNSVGTFKLD